MSYKNYKSPWVLLILFVVGGIVGTWLGEAFGKLLPNWTILKQSETIGLPSVTLDLNVLKITFGFLLKLNIMTVLGFVLAFVVYRRL